MGLATGAGASPWFSVLLQTSMQGLVAQYKGSNLSLSLSLPCHHLFSDVLHCNMQSADMLKLCLRLGFKHGLELCRKVLASLNV